MIDFIFDALTLAAIIGLFSVIFHGIYLGLRDLYEYNAPVTKGKLHIGGIVRVLLALIVLALLYKLLRAHPEWGIDWEFR